MQDSLINPFEADSISEPRYVGENTVLSLNIEPLKSLIQQFELLEKGKAPRKVSLSHAQFVLSPQAGYGKSHLIGRLFHELMGRATLIYLRPYEDISTCWKSIVLKMVQELDFPDRDDTMKKGKSYPTQLECFAHGFLVNLIAEAAEIGKIKIKNKEYNSDYDLRQTHVEKFRKNREWFQKNWDKLLKIFIKILQKNGVLLNASRESWLNVLLICAWFSDDIMRRETCIEWLKGCSIDSDDARLIGVNSSDIPGYEISLEQANNICKERLIDFCRLAGFFRPFVFCFDQTENYVKNPGLARSLGMVVQVLRDEVYNQMTVVTANEAPWLRIRPCWEEAHQNRLGHPLELKELKKEQAPELIRQRLENIDSHSFKTFCTNEWLDQLFHDTKAMGVRLFLQKCAERWRHFFSTDQIQEEKIETYYNKKIQSISNNKRRLMFDPDTLYWLVYEAAKGLKNIIIEEYRSPKGYFNLCWKCKDQVIFFGFEDGDHWKRWDAIAREGRRLFTDPGFSVNGKPMTKIVMFRTPELKPVPSLTAKDSKLLIENAKKEYLHIMVLNITEMERLYAARDIFVDAEEENIPFSCDQTLDFICNELIWFWEKIQKPI